MSQTLTPSELPGHVAIIMDGNGRWARKQGRQRLWGHRRGAESVREVVRASREIGIRVLTLYAFSEENWQRPKAEVRGLMRLLGRYLDKEEEELVKQDIRFRVIGAQEKLPAAIRKKIEHVVKTTEWNSAMVLNLALSYGGRSEIVRAARILAEKCLNGELKPEAISEDMFGNHLYTSGLADPDLLIRTGGEQRISNFLLWQISYTELYMTGAAWPEFRKEQFLEALKEYGKRQRRFGKIGDQIETSGSAG